MRSTKILFAILALALTFSACSDDDTSSSDNTTNPGENTGNTGNTGNEGNTGNTGDNKDTSQDPIYLFGDLTEDVKAKLPLIPVKSIGELGAYPSDITMHGNYAYVVDSGNNAIHRIHLTDFAVEKNYVDLGQNASPYAAHADSEALYVAAQGLHAVIKYPHETPKSPVTINDQLKAPTAVYTMNDNLYIADSEYDYSDSSQTGGKIYVHTKNNEKIALTSSSQNPGFIDYCPLNDWLLTINSGVITFGDTTIPPEKSCVDVWDIPAFSTTAENKPLYTFCADNASLGRPIKSNKILYVGDGLKPVIYKIAIADVPNPGAALTKITLSDESTGLTTPVDLGDQLAVLNFNNDTLTWFDGDKQIKYLLSNSKTATKGPIDAVYDSHRKQLLILNSTAGSVDVLKLNQ